jgi:hypothetical protein
MEELKTKTVDLLDALLAFEHLNLLLLKEYKTRMLKFVDKCRNHRKSRIAF